MAHERLRDWPVSCYKFWLKPEGKVPQEVIEAACSQAKLWNRLVEIARDNAENYKTLLQANMTVADLQEEFDCLKALKEEAYQKLKRAKVAAQSRKKTDPIIEPVLLEYEKAKTDFEPVKEKMKEAKAQAKTVISKEEWDAIYEKFFDSIKEAVSASNVYWCDAAEVRNSFIASWVKTIKKGAIPKFKSLPGANRGDIRFCHRYTGGGTEINKILTDKQLRFSIFPVNNKIYEQAEAGQISARQMKRQAQTVVNVVLGGLYVRFKTILHRHIPDNSILKSVVIKRIMNGSNEDWSMSLTVETPPVPALSAPSTAEKVAAVDVGYRIMRDGSLRIAVLVSNQQEKPMEFYVPDKILKREAFYKELQTKRDLLLEDTKKLLIEMLPYKC